MSFVPGSEAIAAGLEYTRREVPASRVEASTPPFVVFFDCGGLEIDVTCPRCYSDASDIWDQWMEESCEVDTGFAFTKREMPCCGNIVSLEELHLDPACAFGRFAIEIVDTLTTLSAEQWGEFQRGLEGHLGCTLLRIDAHY
jgi:hypothetical protein